MAYPIPAEALDDRLGIVGTSGAGKTYTAMGAVEHLLASGARCVIVDPLDVWWGLRLSADGKQASGINLPILGGAHGDLPLPEHSGLDVTLGGLIFPTKRGMIECRYEHPPCWVGNYNSVCERPVTDADAPPKIERAK